MRILGTSIVVSGGSFVSGTLQFRWSWVLVLASLLMSVYTTIGNASAQFHVVSNPRTIALPDVESAVVGDRTFSLPVQIDESGPRPTEVQLFVAEDPSLDGPAATGEASPPLRWQMLNRQSFPAQPFEVTSNRDGRFFFAIRTLDAGGQANPAGELSAEVEVVIDTIGPKIDLAASATQSGKVEASIRVVDATPIREVLIQYVTDSDNQWRTVDQESIDTKGRLTFSPAQPWRMMTLRVSAMDSAGHTANVNHKLECPRLAVVPGNRLASVDPPSERPAVSVRPLAAKVQTVAGPITRRMYAVPAGTSAAQGGRQAVAPEIVSTPPSEMAPADLPPPATFEEISRPTGRPETQLNQAQSNPFLQDNSAPLTTPALGADPSGTQRRRRDDSGSEWRPGGSGVSPWDPSRVSNTPRTVEQATRPLSTRPQPEEPYESARVQASDSSPVPVDDRVYEAFDPRKSKAPLRYSNSPRFSLEYELEAVGSNGADVVELWGSIDAGQSWSKWGEDPDRKSPFDIQTKGEGVFGFRIVVIGANGLSTPAPRSGESADINVVVDTSKPVTRITGAQYGDGDATGCLVIQYECEDRFLTGRPVTLAFSPSQDGPWTTIAAGLRNDGQYIWPADPGLPPSLFLRIAATDHAGNVGSFSLDQPIDTQGLAPRARIRGFQPLGYQPPRETDRDRDGEQTAKLPHGRFQ